MFNVLVTSATLALMFAASPIQAAASRPASAQRATEQGHRLVGLHIGIGEYTDEQTDPLTLHHTVNNRVVPLLTERFDFDSFESALDVGRNDFRASLLNLFQRATEARDTGDEVTVVFMYTGHGSRVPDDDGDEPDGKDETFVTVNSSITNGSEDVRDDDINAFRHALESRGIHLTMIVEACHSATSFRGPNTAAFGTRGTGVSGPVTRLFEDTVLADYYENETSQDRGWFEGDASERFVILSAARDRQMARAFSFEGEQWGMMTLALYRAISEAPEGATYDEIFAGVVRNVGSLSRDHTIDPSTPMLHVADGRTGDTVFLGQTIAADYVNATLEGERLTIDAGFAAGFESDALVGLYPSVESIRNGQAPTAVTTVDEAAIAGATLRAEQLGADALARLFSADGRAHARLIAPPISQAAVYLDPRLPDPIAAGLRVEGASGRLEISNSLEGATYSVEPSATDPRRLEVRWAIQPIKDNEAAPPPLATFRTEEANGIWDAAEIADELNRLTRIRRLMDLASPSQDLQVEITPTDPDLREAWSHGDRRMPHEAGFSMTIRNDADTPRYIYLVSIAITDDGRLVCEVPVRGMYLRDGDEQTGDGAVQLPEGATSERISYVWISSASPLPNLPRLIADPAARAGTRGSNALYDLLDDAVSTRSAPTADLPWSSLTVEFEIVMR